MTYLEWLSSIFGKRPIWLYEFTRGSTVTRLCARPVGRDYVDDDAVTWTATNMMHTQITQASAVAREESLVVFPQSDAFAREFFDDFSYARNQLVIYHEFRDDTEQARVTKFRGRIVGTERRWTRIRLKAETDYTKGRRKAQPALFTRKCRHSLYTLTPDGQGCPRLKADYSEVATMTALTDNVATVPLAAGQADGFYARGVFTYDGEEQLITGHVGDQITLLAPVPGLTAAAAGGSVACEIARGCPKTTAGCASFTADADGADPHGGFPHATETPFDGKVLY